MAGLRPPEDRETEAIGPGRDGQIGRQEMEEDSNEREQSGDVGVKQGRKRHRSIARDKK